MAPKPIAPAPDDSNNVNGLPEALAVFQAQHHACGLDKTNDFKNFDYTSLAATLQAIQPAAAQGICHTFTFHLVGMEGMVVSRLTVTHAPSGGTLVSEFPLQVGGKLQDVGGSITYAKKYQLWALYGLANASTDDLDSGDGESKQRGQTAPAKQSNRPNPVPPKQQQRPVNTAAVKRDPAPAPAQATETSRQLDESKSLLGQKFEPLTDEQAFAALDAFRDHFKLGVTHASSENIQTLEHAQWLHSYIDNLLKSPDVLPF